MAEIVLPALPPDRVYVRTPNVALAHIGNPRASRPLCGRRSPLSGFSEVHPGTTMALCGRCEFAQYGAAGLKPGSAP